MTSLAVRVDNILLTAPVRLDTGTRVQGGSSMAFLPSVIYLPTNSAHNAFESAMSVPLPSLSPSTTSFSSVCLCVCVLALFDNSVLPSFYVRTAHIRVCVCWSVPLKDGVTRLEC